MNHEERTNGGEETTVDLREDEGGVEEGLIVFVDIRANT